MYSKSQSPHFNQKTRNTMDLIKKSDDWLLKKVATK